MVDDTRRYKNPPKLALKRLLDHQRWLSSNGQFGERLESMDLEFENCDLAGVDFSAAKLQEAVFEGCSLRGARFIGTNLLDSRFISCHIEGADFAGAEISGVIFFDTDHTKGVNLIDNPNFSQVGFNEEDALRIAKEAVAEMVRFISTEAERPEHVKGKPTAKQPPKPRPGG
jgi:uncharacterized protein YjbI with pentapeptide repeats